MDCEDCRHLTVVGLHDSGPRWDPVRLTAKCSKCACSIAHIGVSIAGTGEKSVVSGVSVVNDWVKRQTSSCREFYKDSQYDSTAICSAVWQ